MPSLERKQARFMLICDSINWEGVAFQSQVRSKQREGATRKP